MTHDMFTLVDTELTQTIIAPWDSSVSFKFKPKVREWTEPCTLGTIRRRETSIQLQVSSPNKRTITRILQGGVPRPAHIRDIKWSMLKVCL